MVASDMMTLYTGLTVAGEDPSCPLCSEMMVIASGLIGELVSKIGSQVVLKMEDGSVHQFHRKDLTFAD